MLGTSAFVTDVHRLTVFKKKPPHKTCKLKVNMNISLFVLNTKYVHIKKKRITYELAH